ncbi:MAG: stage III sporulation protein AA [Bacillota bacterium]
MVRGATADGRPAANPAAWRAALSGVLPDVLAQAVRGLSAEMAARAVELRVRLERPLLLVTADGAHFLDAGGRAVADPGRALHADARLVQALVDRICGGSIYAVGEQLRQGFLTLPGGHRVGFGGRAVLGPESSIHALTDISSACIRIARAIPDVARPVLPRLLVRRRGGRSVLASTLVLSPPGAGKTTLLRDLARLASWGVPEMGLDGAQVVIVDERSELAGTFQGVPQHDVGPRTDVLDGCPKVEGIHWALRALGPEALVTDEIGTVRDAETLARAAHTGCTVIASAHAFDVAHARRRPGLAPLFDLGLFERLVVLSRRLGPGTVELVSACGDGEG